MIVLGADAHKRSHTIAAVSASTGELPGRCHQAGGEERDREGVGRVCGHRRGLSLAVRPSVLALELVEEDDVVQPPGTVDLPKGDRLELRTP
jgi:hypothetical protein